MDWTAIFRENVLSANVLAALVVLLGVIITAVVTTRIALGNRFSIEKTASDRIDAERKQNALDRSFPDRAKTYVEARAWLKAFGDFTHHGIHEKIWDAEDWAKPFAEPSRGEILNKIEIYGTSNAARLFQKTAEAFMQCCTHKIFARQMLLIRAGEEREHRDAPTYKQEEQENYRQQHAEELRSADYQEYGFRLLEQFTRLCQDDLADADTGRADLVISPIDDERTRQITRQRQRRSQGLPAIEAGEEEIEDRGR